MAIRDLVIHSQLIPPGQRKGVLYRARLIERLCAVYDYPLTIVQAGTGHSKTTTLAGFAGQAQHLFWYTITEPDRDPLLFLTHLISAFNQSGFSLGESALEALEENGGRVNPAALTPLMNQLTTGLPDPSVLVLDDFHLVAGVPNILALVERLIDYAPRQLHIVLATRQKPQFPSGALTRWQAKNQVFTLKRGDLAFTPPEIEALFREQYGLPITAEQVQALAVETEGWAIALQVIWQSLKSGAVDSVDEVLQRMPETLEYLFNYLAQDVLARLPDHEQNFVLTSSVLRQLTGAACDALLDTSGSEHTLNQLVDRGLFLTPVGEGDFPGKSYRYQHLFHDFLIAQLAREPEKVRSLHRRAATYFEAHQQFEETIHHLLEAEDYDPAAVQIERIGANLIQSGRLDSLVGWILRLPDPVRVEHPELHLLCGDVHRLRAQFDEALASFSAAEGQFAARKEKLGQARALRGQAQVYLDTIRPIKAGALLESALRMLDPNIHRPEIAALLEQLAENHINLGHPDQAQAYLHEARLLRAESTPDHIFLAARALLRTGQLTDSRQVLQDQAEIERQAEPARPQRFHRETAALLSLLCSLMGDGPAAEQAACESIQTGRRLSSAFVEAVGYMRLGHPLMLDGQHPWQHARRSQVIDCYNRAIEIVRPFRVNRVTVEPLWGLCRVHGWFGNLPAAEKAANQALENAQQAGDEWIGHLVRVTMGAALAQVREHAAAEITLLETRAGFHKVNDPFGESAALLWLALNEHWQNHPDAAMVYVAELLERVEQHGYDFLLTRPTHIGMKDEQVVIPLLLAARQRGEKPEMVRRLLHALSADDLADHPGYSLYVRTLGPFDVWRGDTLVRPTEWQREKARHLFQLLLTERGRWLTREQLTERLWPDLEPDAAVRDFKAALNALNRVLEPARPAGAAPFFIVRRDNIYGLNPQAKIVLDADDFERGAWSKAIETLRQTLDLYEEDYLAAEHIPDDEWANPTRDRLRQVYFTAAEHLAERLIQSGQFEAAIPVCQLILTRDRAWEPAYRQLMQIYAAVGNRPQIVNTYNRCAAALKEELDVEPSEETETLLNRLTV